jgi:hypothetical protein
MAVEIPDGHWLGGDDYKELQSDDKTAEFMTRFDTPAKGLKAYHDYHRANAQSLHVPQDLSTLDETKRGELLGKLGKVMGAKDTPEGYELVRPQLPDGLAYDEQAEKALRDWAVKHKIPEAAVKEWYDIHNQAQVLHHESNMKAKADVEQKYEDEKTQAYGEFRKQYTSDDECNKAILHAQGMLNERAKKLGMTEDDVKDSLNSTGKGNNVPLMRILTSLAKDFHAEGKTDLGGGVGSGGELSAEQLWPTSTAQGIMKK